MGGRFSKSKKGAGKEGDEEKERKEEVKGTSKPSATVETPETTPVREEKSGMETESKTKGDEKGGPLVPTLPLESMQARYKGNAAVGGSTTARLVGLQSGSGEDSGEENTSGPGPMLAKRGRGQSLRERRLGPGLLALDAIGEEEGEGGGGLGSGGSGGKPKVTGRRRSEVGPRGLRLPLQIETNVEDGGGGLESGAVPPAPSQGGGRLGGFLVQLAAAAEKEGDDAGWGIMVDKDGLLVTEERVRAAKVRLCDSELSSILPFLRVSGKAASALPGALALGHVVTVLNAAADVCPDVFSSDPIQRTAFSLLPIDAPFTLPTTKASSTNPWAAPEASALALPYLSLRLMDGGGQELAPLFPSVVSFVEQTRKAAASTLLKPHTSSSSSSSSMRTPSVLVHCHQGVSRSGSFGIAVVMWAMGMGHAAALEYVKSRRSVVSPNTGFLVELMEFEEQLRAMHRVYTPQRAQSATSASTISPAPTGGEPDIAGSSRFGVEGVEGGGGDDDDDDGASLEPAAPTLGASRGGLGGGGGGFFGDSESEGSRSQKSEDDADDAEDVEDGEVRKKRVGMLGTGDGEEEGEERKGVVVKGSLKSTLPSLHALPTEPMKARSSSSEEEVDGRGGGEGGEDEKSETKLEDDGSGKEEKEDVEKEDCVRYRFPYPGALPLRGICFELLRCTRPPRWTQVSDEACACTAHAAKQIANYEGVGLSGRGLAPALAVLSKEGATVAQKVHPTMTDIDIRLARAKEGRGMLVPTITLLDTVLRTSTPSLSGVSLDESSYPPSIPPPPLPTSSSSLPLTTPSSMDSTSSTTRPKIAVREIGRAGSSASAGSSGSIEKVVDVTVPSSSSLSDDDDDVDGGDDGGDDEDEKGGKRKSALVEEDDKHDKKSSLLPSHPPTVPVPLEAVGRTASLSVTTSASSAPRFPISRSVSVKSQTPGARSSHRKRQVRPQSSHPSTSSKAPSAASPAPTSRAPPSLPHPHFHPSPSGGGSSGGGVGAGIMMTARSRVSRAGSARDDVGAYLLLLPSAKAGKWIVKDPRQRAWPVMDVVLVCPRTLGRRRRQELMSAVRKELHAWESLRRGPPNAALGAIALAYPKLNEIASHGPGLVPNPPRHHRSDDTSTLRSPQGITTSPTAFGSERGMSPEPFAHSRGSHHPVEPFNDEAPPLPQPREVLWDPAILTRVSSALARERTRVPQPAPPSSQGIPSAVASAGDTTAPASTLAPSPLLSPSPTPTPTPLLQSASDGFSSPLLGTNDRRSSEDERSSASNERRSSQTSDGGAGGGEATSQTALAWRALSMIAGTAAAECLALRRRLHSLALAAAASAATAAVDASEVSPSTSSASPRQHSRRSTSSATSLPSRSTIATAESEIAAIDALARQALALRYPSFSKEATTSDSGDLLPPRGHVSLTPPASFERSSTAYSTEQFHLPTTLSMTAPFIDGSALEEEEELETPGTEEEVRYDPRGTRESNMSGPESHVSDTFPTSAPKEESRTSSQPGSSRHESVDGDGGSGDDEDHVEGVEDGDGIGSGFESVPRQVDKGVAEPLMPRGISDEDDEEGAEEGALIASLAVRPRLFSVGKDAAPYELGDYDDDDLRSTAELVLLKLVRREPLQLRAFLWQGEDVEEKQELEKGIERGLLAWADEVDRIEAEEREHRRREGLRIEGLDQAEQIRAQVREGTWDDVVQFSLVPEGEESEEFHDIFEEGY